jgi:Sap, sulfolipid-1-addressing protein
VIHAGGHVLVYALAAAASPLALTATFVVIRSARPRTNGIAFLSGFLLGTTIACGLGLVVGRGAVNRFDSHATIEGVLTLLLGVLLMLIGLRSLRAAPSPGAETDAGAEGEGSRAGAILAGLADVRPAAAFTMAGLLGFGGPKRLVLTFLAMAAVSGADVGDVADGTLVIVYIAIASALVSVPVGIVIVAGERAAVILDRGQSWLTTHAAVLRLWLSLGIGAALVVDGVVRLFA